MSKIDTSKLTDEQKAALAQVEASLTIQKSTAQQTNKTAKIVKIIAIFIFGVMTVVSIMLLIQAQSSL